MITKHKAITGHDNKSIGVGGGENFVHIYRVFDGELKFNDSIEAVVVIDSVVDFDVFEILKNGVRVAKEEGFMSRFRIAADNSVGRGEDVAGKLEGGDVGYQVDARDREFSIYRVAMGGVGER